jgi:hypothetical protein
MKLVVVGAGMIGRRYSEHLIGEPLRRELSGSIVASWSRVLTSGEITAFRHTRGLPFPVGCTHFCAIGRRRLNIFVPLRRQIPQFAEVTRGTEAPLVSRREWLKKVKALAAVKESAACAGEIVRV